jgi:hypothetical protein
MLPALLCLFASCAPVSTQAGYIDLAALDVADAYKLHGQRVVARVHLGTAGYEINGIAAWGNFGPAEVLVVMPARLARDIPDEDEPFFARGLLRVVRLRAGPSDPGWEEVRFFVESLGR